PRSATRGTPITCSMCRRTVTDSFQGPSLPACGKSAPCCAPGEQPASQRLRTGPPGCDLLRRLGIGRAAPAGDASGAPDHAYKSGLKPEPKTRHGKTPG